MWMLRFHACCASRARFEFGGLLVPMTASAAAEQDATTVGVEGDGEPRPSSSRPPEVQRCRTLLVDSFPAEEKDLEGADFLPSSHIEGRCADCAWCRVRCSGCCGAGSPLAKPSKERRIENQDWRPRRVVVLLEDMAGSHVGRESKILGKRIEGREGPEGVAHGRGCFAVARRY